MTVSIPTVRERAKKPLSDRFWSKVDRSGGPDACWPWTGTRGVRGYGQITHGKNGRYRAHRLAWELHNGSPPGELLVCHSCDNPPCCNPAHLFLGTPAANMEDKMAKGRHRFFAPVGEANGRSTFTPEIVRRIRSLYPANSQYEIAALIGCSRGAVASVLSGRTWSHLV